MLSLNIFIRFCILREMNENKIDIVLPVRIGDSILSLPGIICLKQLDNKYKNNSKIKILALPFIQKLLAPLNAFECKNLDIFSKISSNLFPAQNALFIEATSKNIGYKAQKTYGISNPAKKLQKYTYEADYLNFENIKEIFSDRLYSFLNEKCKLSLYSMSVFGFCMDLGYSEEQIIETFNFSPDNVSLENYSGYKTQELDGKYVVSCMEAGYGRKGNEMRYWGCENHFMLARKIYEEHNIKSVFIGKTQEDKLPDEDFFVDLRGKIDLYELACVMKNSVMYVGNDTGPLHVANLMKKKAVSLYFKENTLTESSPIFYDLNIQVFQPGSVEEVYEKVCEVLNQVN